MVCNFFVPIILILAAPAATAPVRIAPGGVLWLEGDSTLHPYKSSATVLSITGERSDFKPISLSVEIPVEGLKSGDERLDKNMQKALKAAEHPVIRFTLAGSTVTQDTVSISGKLEIAGKAADEEIAATISPVASGLRVRGKKELLMTDFGIKPPSMLGMIRTKDKIEIFFDFIVLTQESRDKEKVQ